MKHASRLMTGALLISIATLAGCSDSSGPTNDPLTAGSTNTVGAAMASTVSLAVAAITPSTPDFGGGFPLFSSNGHSVGGGLSFSPPVEEPECPTASDLTDTDSDGVPDNAIWTFDAATCTSTDEQGNSSVVTGSVALSDPGLTPGYDLHLNDLTGQYFESGAVSPLLQLVMNGDWMLRGTSQALSLDQNYQFAITVQAETASLTNDLVVGFTAGSGSSIAWGVPLPDGTLSIDGSWRLASTRENHSLSLLTVTPLSYDAVCGGIVAGTLEAKGDGGSVRITWTGCDQYSGTFTKT